MAAVAIMCACALILEERHRRVAAIGLDGLPAELTLGSVHHPHLAGAKLIAAAKCTPIVDGSGIRAGSATLGCDPRRPRPTWHLCPKAHSHDAGINHSGLAQALGRRKSTLRYADPLIYFALPDRPGVGSKRTLDQAAAPTLEQLKYVPFRRLHPQPGQAGHV